MGNLPEAISFSGSATALSDPTIDVEKGKTNRLGVLQVFPHQGNAVPNAWHINTSSTLGRAPQTNIRIDDQRVSRQHARLDEVSGAIRVADLGSSHGTYVDGRNADTQGILAHPGSVLRVGRTLLLVAADVEASTAPIHQISANFLGLAHDVLAGPCLWDIWQTATRVATLTQPVLVVGESGSGKEATARILHAARSVPGPFLVANATVIRKYLSDMESWEYLRKGGAGDSVGHSGEFPALSGGVLFIDEVADWNLELQATLLRVLDQGYPPSPNATEELSAQPRIIAATRYDLQQACKEGRFRQDLLYRLSGITINVPPLRARRTDIIALAQSIIDSQAERLQLSVRAAEALLLAQWEGNVRQLNYVVLRGLVRALGADSKHILPEHLADLHSAASGYSTNELTCSELVSALTQAQGNASAAAKSLGVSRATLYNLFKRHGIDPRVARRKVG